jgi:hypothetical protein
MNTESSTASQHVCDGEGEIPVGCSGRGSTRSEGWIGGGAGTVPIGVFAFFLGLAARRRLEFHARQRVAG